MFRSLAVVSILATLTSGAALESIESRTAPRTVRTLAAADPGVTTVRTTPVTLPPPETSSTTSSPPSTSISTSTTSSTVADLTMEDIAGMRPLAEDSAGGVVEFTGSVSFSVSGVPFDEPATRESCISDAKASPLTVDGVYDRNLIAQMTHEVFECLTAVAGLDEVAPTALRRWNGAAVWGFGSLAQQVAAEAVVVAYCESIGFNSRALTSSNGFGYGGLFQMGSVEMRRFGEIGSSRFDPVDNAVAAANYFLFQYRNRAGWGGWSPWAVVNTNFSDEVNDQVKVPVLPRFNSTDPEFRGRPGPELPAWAVDPWEWTVPHWNGTGCPYNGGRWPAAAARTRD